MDIVRMLSKLETHRQAARWPPSEDPCTLACPALHAFVVRSPHHADLAPALGRSLNRFGGVRALPVRQAGARQNLRFSESGGRHRSPGTGPEQGEESALYPSIVPSRIRSNRPKISSLKSSAGQNSCRPARNLADAIAFNEGDPASA